MPGRILNTYFADEQQAVDYIAKFLVRVVGWELEEYVVNTASEVHVVLSSPGEELVNNSNRIYIGIRGFSNLIYLYTYATYTDFSTNTEEVSNSTYGRISFGSGEMVIVADLERVLVCAPSTTTHSFIGYAGRINSYYKESEHPYPHMVKGMQSNTYHFLYQSVSGRNMFLINKSGSVDTYEGVELVDSSLLTSASFSDRSGVPPMFAIPIVNRSGGVDGEIVGEVRGVYVMQGAIGNQSIIKVGGFYFYALYASYVYALGPISDEDVEPDLYPNFDTQTSLV